MAKTRAKTTASVIPSKAEAVDAQNRYAAAFVSIEESNAKMEAEIQAIREKYQDDILEKKEAMQSDYRLIQTWAEANKDMFESKRSYDWGNAVVGYRMGTDKVAVRPGTKNPVTGKAANMSTIAAALYADNHTGYLKEQKPTLDKKAVQDAMKTPTDERAVLLSGYGLMVIKEEAFFVDVKTEELEA